MNALRHWLALILLSGCLAAAAAAPDLGVVMIHGKQGSPTRDAVKLVAALRSRGYAVTVPVMPWAQDKIYSASYAAGLVELAGQVADLRRQGAARVLLIGFSLGANAALGYAAAYPGLSGLVLLAPGHFPESADYQRRVAPQRARALRLVAAGQGGVPAAFQDAIQGFMIDVWASPEVFLGYSDPAGPAVMARNAAAIHPAVPILLIQENNPAVAAADAAIFHAAPFDPRSRYVRSTERHLGVPDAAIPEILAWILTLSESAPPRSPPARQ